MNSPPTSSPFTLSSPPIQAAQASPARTLLLTYLSEQYAALATLFDLFASPRAHFRGLHVLRPRLELGQEEVVLLLADARGCPLLPKELRALPSPRRAREARPGAKMRPTVPPRLASGCIHACVSRAGAPGCLLFTSSFA